MSKNEKNVSVRGLSHVFKNFCTWLNSQLSPVAKSGDYNDLSNKPTIPTIPSSLPANGGNAATVGGYTIWTGTQAQYNAIGNKSSTTIYFIKEG